MSDDSPENMSNKSKSDEDPDTLKEAKESTLETLKSPIN